MFLPNNEHKFHVKVQGERTQEWFEGDFCTKCLLTNEETVDVAIRTDRYNKGATNIASQFVLMNRVFAEMEIRVVRDKEGKMQAPTWWVESDGGRTLRDPNIAFHVFNKTMEGEAEWMDRLKKKVEKDEKEAEKSPRKPPAQPEEVT